MFDFLTSNNLAAIGAGYAAVQAFAAFLAMVLPKHTIVARGAREVAKWPAQIIPKPVTDPADPKNP